MSNRTVGQPGQRCSSYEVPNYYDRFSLGSIQGSRAGATDVAHLPAAARNIRGPGEGVQPETTFMQSPDGESEWHCGDDGEKCVGSSGNDEGHGRWRRDTRCCTQEEKVGVVVLVSS